MLHMIDFRDSLTERFIRYTEFNTMSDPHLVGEKRPTTDGQRFFQKELLRELEELGLETYYSDESVVMGVLKGNTENGKRVGFLSHVDVSSDVNGNNVKAILHKAYNGGKIVLDGVSLSQESDPDLMRYIGSDIITSDGTSLLGSDDKAGIAIIMEALKYLSEHKEIEHGDIEVYFTPDEETGSGMDMFPYDRLKSYVTYTVDGEEEDVIETECFNASSVELEFRGRVCHLGEARGKMVNALKVASEVISMLPQAESPEATDGKYGYYAPFEMHGTLEKALLTILIRDFDEGSFERRIDNVRHIAESVAKLYGAELSVKTSITYHNMAKANLEKPEARLSIAESAKKLGFEIRERAIRGGTDGAKLAELKIPSPNIFTGGHNLHSLREWVSVDAMNKSVNLVLGIIDYWKDKK